MSEHKDLIKLSLTLKSCPFCGYHPVCGREGGSLVVACSNYNCGLSASGFSMTPEQWNRRVIMERIKIAFMLYASSKKYNPHPLSFRGADKGWRMMNIKIEDHNFIMDVIAEVMNE